MERWELDLFYRLAEILSFQTSNDSFLACFYDYLDRADRDIQDSETRDEWRSVESVEITTECTRDEIRGFLRWLTQVNARSWSARSRSRLATGLVLTAPGIPMLFMGARIP